MTKPPGLVVRVLPLAMALSACTALLDSQFEAARDGSVEGDAGPDATLWTKVTGGAFHTCGLRSDGTLWCWGSGGEGRLGHGSEESSDTPVRVLAAGEAPGGAAWDDWVDVSAGSSHTCGRRSDDSLWCWGAGGDGQRGDGTLASVRTTPVQVLADEEGGGAPWEDWVEVSAGSSYTCGRRSDHSLWCWGDGAQGKRGDGETDAPGEPRPTPTRVLADEAGSAPWSDWTEVSAGQIHTCGRRQNGSLWCWGSTENGKLGVGSSECFPDLAWGLPVQVVQEGGCSNNNPEWWTDWREVTAGRDHTCGRRNDGSLWCWGRRELGRLGDGYTSGGDEVASTPTPVLPNEDEADATPWTDWTQVTAGHFHTCGIRDEGSLWCWGHQVDGRLGHGTEASNAGGTPVQVLAADAAPAVDGGVAEAWTDWVEVTGGGNHTCGIRDGGSLWCWGRGGEGQLGAGGGDADGGIPSRTTPVAVVEPPSDA